MQCLPGYVPDNQVGSSLFRRKQIEHCWKYHPVSVGEALACPNTKKYQHRETLKTPTFYTCHPMLQNRRKFHRSSKISPIDLHSSVVGTAMNFFCFFLSFPHVCSPQLGLSGYQQIHWCPVTLCYRSSIQILVSLLNPDSCFAPKHGLLHQLWHAHCRARTIIYLLWLCGLEKISGKIILPLLSI